MLLLLERVLNSVKINPKLCGFCWFYFFYIDFLTNQKATKLTVT